MSQGQTLGRVRFARRSRPSSSLLLGTEGVGAAVDALQPLDPVDVGAGLREPDALAERAPDVDVVLARVVRGERAPLVAVLVEQVPQVPGAVADVDLGVVQVLHPEARAAGAERDSL